MFTDHDLRELLDFVSSEPVLSLYLNTEPSEGNADAYRLRLKGMLKDIHMSQDVAVIEKFFNHGYDWSGRGVAVFSCAAKGFFRAYPLAVPVRNLVHVSDRPSVKPLADLLDNFGGYGVVLVDKQGARVFNFHLGEVREQEGVLGEAVKHTKRGGASSFPGRRGGIAGRTDHMEEVVERNMKEAVEFAVHFFEENHVRRVLIGGSDENVSLFRAELPKAWQSLVMGTFTMAMTANTIDVRNRMMEISANAAHASEEALVEALVTNAAKRNSAVIGLADTLEAVSQDRVRTLVFVEELRKEGFVCSHCGALYANKVDETCPACTTGRLERTLDAVDLAVNAVMRKGGEVAVVRPAASLEDYENIGALLRY